MTSSLINKVTFKILTCKNTENMKSLYVACSNCRIFRTTADQMLKSKRIMWLMKLTIKIGMM